MTNAAFTRPRQVALKHAAAHKSGRRGARRIVASVALGGVVFAFAALGGADGALRAGANSALNHFGRGGAAGPSTQATASSEASAATAIIWTIDVDSDGIADFSNPTRGGVRGIDAFGSGDYGAVRDAGKRRHHGVDYVSEPGADVLAPQSGKVTRIGFAYNGSEELHYVEITNPETNLRARVLYVSPAVAEGDMVSAGETLGVAEDLTDRYPGITNHVHVEMRDAQRRWIDVSEHLPSAPTLQAQRQSVVSTS